MEFSGAAAKSTATGRVAVVTGAAGGIGAALAQRLAQNGARVAITDVNADKLASTAARLTQDHPGAIFAQAGDASSERDLSSLIAETESQFGPVEMFFANAGVGGGVGLDASEHEWGQAIQVNVLGHVRAARLLVPRWIERGGGYFVSTASAAGLITQLGSATYAVSKHGAVAFAEWLAVTYGKQGIKVSCLCPMGVNTDMLTGGDGNSAGAVAQVSAKAVTEAGTVLEPLEVAGIVLDAIRDERFLILPHPEVLDFFQRKTSDYDRWIRGMRRYQEAVA
ncbi:SDR family oxidoreductase [Hoyosella altamirensis]|uniref:NAD(P)-dependent dehydrogenase (Short-subunit alcohol dehydrogenase family) n=1 Tax=Hoyosella altamirensis TaxID=616997 RepID=A0A839RJW8_9ACTN|nr:SDR family oxidoreductase [Hoyosella altamirensis]MBB3036474.1 NAD(P)-dependent dehydrogenase (short-subunit alcohol dehydrogenase family) [Hoyosella altamirensis]